MKFDVISVFPEFFRVLDLSLLGKAQEAHLIDIRTHDLREWASDVHRTVDDAPFGGGAGMVMKPDVWGRAIDAVTDEQPYVLAIPTPSGVPLTQPICEKLAMNAEHIVIACGRYEGIDSRVAQYYGAQPGVTVLEYSLGDYVLNGGEVAAVALIEAVGRLVPGMVGNPESLVEESHGSAGLLEYPVFTRPSEFRGLSVPDVLTSGHHAAVARWRRDQALERTSVRRPDMLRKLPTSALDKKDRATLAQHGWFVNLAADGSPRERLTNIQIRPARREETEAVSTLAASTFPDAAPNYISARDIEAFIDAQLQPIHFDALIADPDHHLVTVAEVLDVEGSPTGILAGYTWTVLPEGDSAAGVDEGAPVSFVTADGVRREGPLLYLEKAYLARQWRSTGLFRYMMSQTVGILRSRLAQRSPVPTVPYLWLGTHADNKRAQRAYKRYGFEYSGTRTFYVGDQINNDVTMCLRLDMAQ